MSKYKIFLAIPYKYNTEPETRDCIRDKINIKNNTYDYVHISERRGSPNVYAQRHNTAVDFLATDCDYYLYFDSDQTVIYPDNFLEMLIHDNKDIISPLIVRTIFPFTPACISFERQTCIEKGTDRIEDFRDKRIYPQDRPFKVYYSCGGIVLIKREVLEKVDKPFLPIYNERTGNLLSTELGLYTKAKKLGYECWIEPRIKAGHIGKFIFMIDDYYTLIDTKTLRIENGRQVAGGEGVKDNV